MYYGMLLFGLTFLCSYAADNQIIFPLTMHVRYYATIEDRQNDTPTGIVTLSITATTTFSELQEKLREKLGPGYLMQGSIKIDSWGSPHSETIISYINSLTRYLTVPQIEKQFSFWCIPVKVQEPGRRSNF